ncbi:hypothetical protein O181_086750 [Austropuccinia psidii MF-1]|uniref:Secreted protein n=1 Tax=Austropuccinia psidii MF-1 TaxID=1389203 RepID=A0A9Q3FUV0_9BASI|nr:hypothetical protein [Austropuccinia psidii MF-1]
MPPTLLTILTLALCPPAMPTTLLTILTLAPCHADMPPTPPSHWPNPQCQLSSLRSCSALKMRLQCFPPSPPSPLLRLLNPRLIFTAAYNYYAPAASSR